MIDQKARQILNQRLARPKLGRIDIRSTLKQFALINGQNLALLSVVPFWDADFNFVRVAPWLKWQFGQTNHRVYVIDTENNNEHAVWFFGTTLGSRLVHCAQALWKIPWHYAPYNLETDDQEGSIHYTVGGDWCACDIKLTNTHAPLALQDGFTSLDEMRLILTHPVTGYYYCSDSILGSYSIWHEEIPLTMGKPENLYFSLYDRLGILTPEEMQTPHSIFISPEIIFDVHLPPKRFPKEP